MSRHPAPPPFPPTGQYGSYPPPPPRSNQNLIIGVSIGAAVLIIGVVIAIVVANRRPTATAHNESVTQKYQEATDAFSGSSTAGAAATAADTPDVQKAMDEFAAAIRAKDSVAVAAVIDAGRMIDEVEAQGLSGKMSGNDKRQFAAGAGPGMARSIVSNPGMQYKRIEVRKLKPIAGRSEAVAYVRAWLVANYAQTKMRLWVRKTTTGGWQIYDFEDLDGGIRISDFIAGGLAAFAGDIPGAKSALAAMEGVSFPPQIDALRVMMKGLVEIAQGKLRQGPGVLRSGRGAPQGFARDPLLAGDRLQPVQSPRESDRVGAEMYRASR
jgi:hypothetical protein